LADDGQIGCEEVDVARWADDEVVRKHRAAAGKSRLTGF